MNTQLLEKRKVRKDGRRIGLAIAIYMVILLLVANLFPYAHWIASSGFNPQTITSAVKSGQFHEMALSSTNEGACMIAATACGITFLACFFRKDISESCLFQSNRKMTGGRFWLLTSVFLGCQLIFSLVSVLLEAGLNAIGLSAMSSIEQASATGLNGSTLLYAGIIAPIVEELVFRGFLMRYLEKHGKVIAVVLPAILFGFMHCNLPQGIFATCVGLILGYVAIEHSVIWSIALHLINNLVLGEILPGLMGRFGQQAQILAIVFVKLFFAIAAIVLVIRYRKQIVAWLRSNMWEKPKFRWLTTSVCMLVFFLGTFALALTGLTVL